MRFSCLPVLPGSAEAQVIWGGTVQRQRLLTAYTLSITLLPKISKCIHVCQGYSKRKVGRFLRHSVHFHAQFEDDTLGNSDCRGGGFD